MTAESDIRKLLNQEIVALQGIPTDQPWESVLKLMVESKEQNGKIVVSGMGKAGYVGKSFSASLASVGVASTFLHPTEAQHGDLGTLQADDMLFLISNSGKTSELLDLVGLSERIFPSIKIVTLTGHPENQLSQLATHALATGNPEEICPLGLTPTTSTSVMKVICDILIARLIEITGFTKADFAKRHHSGYLGERSRA